MLIVSEPYDINNEVANIARKIVDIESDVKSHDDVIESIKNTQKILAEETVDIIDVIAKKTDENQIKTMNAIEDLKKSQKKWWTNLHWSVKLIIIFLILTYLAGSYLAIFTNIAD